MSNSDIVKSYLVKYPDTKSKRELAKIIFNEHPNEWRDIESVRSMVRRLTGSSGDKARKEIKDKSFIEEFNIEKNPLLKKISEIYSPQELLSIANGAGITAKQKATQINFSGKHIRIGLMGDTHIGSIYCDKEWIFQAFEQFKKEHVDFVCHTGDVYEGMSNRPGHIYELTHLGYENQRKEGIEIFSQWTESDIYAIDGNHDRWFIKSNGALIVKDTAAMLPNFKFIGHDEGDIDLDGRAIIKLWHGEDSSSYSVSYRIQKVIEAFTGGEKPNALFLGHVHKSTYLFERNIHAYSSGCIEKQSKWMRAKRLAAHTGFWIVDLWVGERGITKSQGCFYPFYS